ncbi:MAG: hypothetical protein KGH65_03730 [Candidatus Micrarchaeota archaeon]|nr:hypothetical protein [Candidatus Micrarchaeota archaeon]
MPALKYYHVYSVRCPMKTALLIILSILSTFTLAATAPEWVYFATTGNSSFYAAENVAVHSVVKGHYMAAVPVRTDTQDGASVYSLFFTDCATGSYLVKFSSGKKTDIRPKPAADTVAGVLEAIICGTST